MKNSKELIQQKQTDKCVINFYVKVWQYVNEYGQSNEIRIDNKSDNVKITGHEVIHYD
ncbi:hypothetical protein [Paenibacillus solani]|uniref:hypothetical protein n=1 Tax=Paenibacillus solani TaxID=1705565 RepID=UPI000A55DC09|nr:hypothetical protein [Paenibacillus solani]